jgi:proteasome lid subunit RPN8/RPN11
VGGFGVCNADDLLLVEDIMLVKQEVSMASVEFDDNSVADFTDRMVDEGFTIEQFARIWVHTHPGDSPNPSWTDEATFERVFGRNPWAVMLIVAQDNSTYCRLRFNAGPGGEVELPSYVSYKKPFLGSNVEAWDEEYLANVNERKWGIGFQGPYAGQYASKEEVSKTGETVSSYYTRQFQNDRSFMDEAWEEYAKRDEGGFRDEVNGVPAEFLSELPDGEWEVRLAADEALDEAAFSLAPQAGFTDEKGVDIGKS